MKDVNGGTIITHPVYALILIFWMNARLIVTEALIRWQQSWFLHRRWNQLSHYFGAILHLQSITSASTEENEHVLEWKDGWINGRSQGFHSFSELQWRALLAKPRAVASFSFSTLQGSSVLFFYSRLLLHFLFYSIVNIFRNVPCNAS